MSNHREYFNGLPPARDRRRKMRVTPRSLVDANFGDTKAIVTNVSESGMALAVGDPPDASNCLIRIRFQLPTSGQSIEVFACVVRLTKSNKGVGVRLIDLTPDVTAEIANWVASEKSAVDFGQLTQTLQCNKKLATSARETKKIFSSPVASDQGENVAARYATIFPSESAHGERVAAPGRALGALSIAERARADADGQIGRAAARGFTSGVSDGMSSPVASVSAEPAMPQARASFTGLGCQTRNHKAGAEGSSQPYIFDVTGPRLAALVYVFVLIGLAIGIAATKASVDVLTAMGYGPFAKHVRVRPPSPSPGTQMPAPPPDLASKEWALSIKPGAAPAAVSSPVRVSPDQTSAASAGSDSAKENSAEANPSSAASATTRSEKTGNTWDFLSGAKTPNVDSHSPSSVTASPDAAQTGATADRKVGSESTAQQANRAEANAVGPQPSADSETSVRGNDFRGLIARSTPQRTTNPEPADSTAPEGQARSAARGRGPLLKNAVVVSPKSSPAATSQKHVHTAVVASPTRNGPKNLTRQIAKSARVEARPSLAVSSKRSRHDDLSASKSAERGKSIVHAAKSAAAKPPKPSLAATEQHSETAKNTKNEAAATPRVEHAPKSEAAKESKPEVAVAKKEHRAPTLNEKNIVTSPDLDSAKNEAMGTVKAPAVPNSKPSEKKPTPAVAAATPKNAVNPSGPVAKLVVPAMPPAAKALPKSTEDSAPLAPKPAAPEAPNAPSPNPILSGDFVSVPSKSGRSQRVTFPQRQIANSSSLAINSQLSVVVPVASGAAGQPSQLQAGKLVSYVLPHNPKPGDHYRAEETVEVQATVGQQGFVTDIKPMSGPIFLLSSAMSAVRSWRYKPTLVNGTPVETHQDVTITFKLAR
jgi:hypothetical protein